MLVVGNPKRRHSLQPKAHRNRRAGNERVAVDLKCGDIPVDVSRTRPDQKRKRGQRQPMPGAIIPLGLPARLTPGPAGRPPAPSRAAPRPRRPAAPGPQRPAARRGGGASNSAGASAIALFGRGPSCGRRNRAGWLQRRLSAHPGSSRSSSQTPSLRENLPRGKTIRGKILNDIVSFPLQWGLASLFQGGPGGRLGDHGNVKRRIWTRTGREKRFPPTAA
jgi:hypothetical protein